MAQSQSWARRYGWRPLSPMEQQVSAISSFWEKSLIHTLKSYFLFWVEISKRMEIRDVPGSLDELEEWTQVRHSILRSRAISMPRYLYRRMSSKPWSQLKAITMSRKEPQMSCYTLLQKRSESRTSSGESPSVSWTSVYASP